MAASTLLQEYKQNEMMKNAALASKPTIPEHGMHSQTYKPSEVVI